MLCINGFLVSEYNEAASRQYPRHLSHCGILTTWVVVEIGCLIVSVVHY